MVSDEDLTTAEDHEALVEEVREECAKFGNLRNIQVPRTAVNGGTVQASAIRKIFVEYATVADAEKAEKELAGRQFGASVVETSYFSEADFAAGRLF
jgi:splicing factor U2AF subunit